MKLFGTDVIVNNSKIPRMTLSDEASAVVTPEFRKEMNEWMLGFFGADYLIPDGQMIAIDDFTVMVNQASYDQMMKVYKSQEAGWMNPLGHQISVGYLI